MVSKVELTRFLADNAPARQFVPYCTLSEKSDTLTVYFEADADYSERLSDHVTLYRSLESGKVVGCRIKGVAAILADLPNYVSVNHDGIQLSLILFAFRGGVDATTGATINELARIASSRQMFLETST